MWNKKQIEWVFLTLLLSNVAASTLQEYKDAQQVGGYKDYIGNLINDTLNGVLAHISDPLRIPDMKSPDFGNSTLVSGGFSFTNMKVDGVKGIVASQIDFNVFAQTLNMTIWIPEVNVNFNYWIDMVIGEIVPIFGSGLNNIYLEYANISIDARGQLVGGGLHVSDVVVCLELGNMTFNLNGLLDNPELSALISTALNDNFAEFMDKYEDLVTSIVSPIVEAIMNKILGPKSEFALISNFDESKKKMNY